MKNKFNTLLATTMVLQTSQIAWAQNQNVAVAQENTPVAKNGEKQAEHENRIKAESKKVWGDFLNALDNARITYKQDAPSLDLVKGLSLGGNYRLESSPSIGNKYSGIDVWEVGVNIMPEILGLTQLPISAGISATRQITYIQQFNTRLESIARVPYDPITKLPLKAEDFFKINHNPLAKKNEYNFKVGDFVGFRAPLTLSLGKNFLTEEVLNQLKLDINANYIINGEFDVHVFRMSENLVRVKVLVVKDKAKNLSTGINIFGFSGVGKLIVKRFFDLDVLTGFINKKDSDLFLADYVFNLNSPEARGLYDELVGHKMRIVNTDEMEKHIKNANPFKSDEDIKEKLIGDLQKLSRMSIADQAFPHNKKRIIQLTAAHNTTLSKNKGFKISLFSLAKLKSDTTKSNSRIAFIGSDGIDNKNVYLLNSIQRNFSYEWFWLWGEKDVNTTSLLVKTDKTELPTEVVGLHVRRVKEDNSMNKKEYEMLKTDLNALLPAPIAAKLNFPNWNFQNGKINNVYVEQEVFFTNEVFNLDQPLTIEGIKKGIIHVLKALKGKIDTKPEHEPYYNGGEQEDPKLRAFQLGDYEYAFAKEINDVANRLENIFNKNTSSNDKYIAFQKLTEEIPLFNEINALILLKILPEHNLENSVVARLAISGRDVQGSVMEFPNKEEFKKMILFKDILSQNDFIVDRSYNLRNYLKEDGSIYSLDEVMAIRNK